MQRALTRKIWSRLKGAGRGGRALPTRDVDGFEVFSHLGQLDGVEPGCQE